MDSIILEKLIKAHDGNVALVYIYLLANKNAKHEQIAIDLCMTVHQVEEAEEKIKLMDINPNNYHSASKSVDDAPSSKVLEPIIEPRNYTSKEILDAEKKEDFSVIRRRTTDTLGHPLGKADLEKLLDIYDNLEMPADVIYVLLNYCEKISYRTPTMSFIVKQAYHWHGLGIQTSEEAEKYSDKIISLNSEKEKIKKALGINERNLKPSENAYVESWIREGYTIEQIEAADDITFTNTGKRAWAYMNAVLSSKSEDKEKNKSSSNSKKSPKPLPNPNDIVKTRKG